MNRQRMRVCFSTLYPNTLSSRYRVYQYVPKLRDHGIEAVVRSAVSETTFARFYNSSSFTERWRYHVEEFFRVRRTLKDAPHCDLLFIQKGCALIDWKFWESPLAKLHSGFVYDLDDAVFLSPPATAPRLLSFLENSDQVSFFLRESKKVIAGNRLLADYARQFNSQVEIIPTPVNTDQIYPNPQGQDRDPRVLGWVGSAGTRRYLNAIAKPLSRVASKYPKMKFIVVSDSLDGIDLGLFSPLEIDLVKWDADRERENLWQMDIGLMPQPDTDWARYKCGYKALQYMAAGVPVVASPIGVIPEMLREGAGILVHKDEQWCDRLCELIESPVVRANTVRSGLSRVHQDYSLNVCSEKLAKCLLEIP